MRGFLPQLLILVFLGTIAPPHVYGANTKKTVTAAPMNQTEAQILSHQINDKGSDESLRNSTVYAMQALMHLAAGELPSAVKNGYNAYGKYRNSENLDKLKDENAYLANSMGAVGAAPVIAGPAKTDTTFRRLDPSFLSQGEAGKVAAEFEKQTGMKRAEFLKQMADVSEKKIKRSDPMMIDKAFSRFESFLSKIPNAEFRKNAEKSINKVPNTMRRGMVAQAVQKLAGFFADAGPTVAPPIESTISESVSAKLAANSGNTDGTTKNSSAFTGVEDSANSKGDKESERHPAAMGTLGDTNAINSKEKSLRDDKNGYGAVVVAALDTQGKDGDGSTKAGSESSDGEVTIFQQVTKRYRILTPDLSK